MGENYITCQGEKGSIYISEDVLTGMVELSQNGEPLFAPFVDESMELIDYVMEERVVS